MFMVAVKHMVSDESAENKSGKTPFHRDDNSAERRYLVRSRGSGNLSHGELSPISHKPWAPFSALEEMVEQT
jgi:hypothetical protein